MIKWMRIHLGPRGQTILEYTVILIILLGAVIVMKDYVKRGIQGRWKTSADDLGSQYDPQYVNSNITYQTTGTSSSLVSVSNGFYTNPTDGTTQTGQWTTRTDSGNTQETKTGTSQVGS